MTEQEQRIAIAEACGWQDVMAYADSKVIGLPPGFTEDQCPEGADEDVPDYLHDLNAMHEAEGVLSKYQRIIYLEHLTPKFTAINDRDWIAFHATAAQRAEAFLKVKGKWKD